MLIGRICVYGKDVAHHDAHGVCAGMEITMESRVICNQCGRVLKMENGILKEDAFEARKEWGYFSKKDMTMHAFVLCEDCYDKMTEGFAVPVTVEGVNEL